MSSGQFKTQNAKRLERWIRGGGATGSKQLNVSRCSQYNEAVRTPRPSFNFNIGAHFLLNARSVAIIIDGSEIQMGGKVDDIKI